MSIPYRFMPWARRGLARSHRNADAANAPLAARPRVSVGLTLQAKRDGNAATAVSGNVDLTLYGPADVIGIDPRLVIRTDPKPNITNFEPNYLAVIDFDPPDFPWLLTPAQANVNHQLRPWLVLVVLDRAKVRLPTVRPGRPLPSLELTAEDVASELPDLSESPLWAHAQAVSQKSKADEVGLAAEMKQFEERNISRLVCPRRLEPRKNYVACVVPAFDGGRLRGLGQPAGAGTLAPAWNHAQPTATELPVYYHWEFSTGPVGDIETLARRLRTPQQYSGDPGLIKQLRHIGEQPVAVDGDHLLFDGLTPGRTVFEGAMVSLDFKPEAPNATFAQKLEAILESGQALATRGTPKPQTVPTLAPPIYGEHPARRHTVDPARINAHWLDGLSLQPRYRLTAGWGAEVVRHNQDEFMQAAWQQVGEVLAAERAFSMSRLARDVLMRIKVRHLDKLPEARLLAILAPAQARIRVAPDRSLHGRIADATLPDELFDGAMRRLTTARRPTIRMAQWRERNLSHVSPPRQMVALVDKFANASRNLDSIDPNRFVPDGLMGSVSFDKIPLPQASDAIVDLEPFTGVPGRMTAAQIRTIQQQNAAARAAGAQLRPTPPQMGDVMRQGLITETHALRFAELEKAAGRPLQGDFAQLVQQASGRGSEGVLVSVNQSGVLQAQSMRIDARNGALTTFGSTFVAGPLRAMRAAPEAKLPSRRVGVVSPQAVTTWGGDAVFTTLPPNSIGHATRNTVTIGAVRPGVFVGVSPTVGSGVVRPIGGADRPDVNVGVVRPDIGTLRPDIGGGVRPDIGGGVIRPEPGPPVATTITVPAAIRDQAVLQRYTDAFKDYQQIALVSDKPAVTIHAVDFAVKPATDQTRTRIDPARSVPARLASTLTLGAQNVALVGTQLAHPLIAARLDLASVETLRYVLPLFFDRVMAYPNLVFPLSRKLETLAPEVFLPGVGLLPNDFIMAVKTNPRFVEAFMLGANHEMGRELLWQGFPTDQRGTPFQHFWQRLDGAKDIAPIHRWAAAPLGAQPGSTVMLVLLIRGQLLERFPTLSVYAYPIDAQENRPGGSSPPVAAGATDPKEMDPNRMILPVMKGRLGKDITYIGFNINPDQIEKFFFILEEQMTEPRFGFDDPDAENRDGPSWLDVDWSEVRVAAGAYFGATNLRFADPAKNKPQWVNPHAATVADALLQRPFRGFYKGAALKMPR
jgi:hypothetical protein